MKKYVYIIIVGLLSFGFLENQYTNRLPIGDIQLIFLFIWACVGYILFPQNKNTLNRLKNRKWVYYFFAIFFSSAFSPLFSYNQPLFQTIIAQRVSYLILFVSVFLYNQPTEDDFYKAFRFLGVLALLSFMLSFIYPQFYFNSETVENMVTAQIESGFFQVVIPQGRIMCGALYFYFLINRFIKTSKISYLIGSSIFIVYIILAQNRSTIIGTLPFYFYAMCKVKFKYKTLLLSTVIIVGLVYFASIFNSLLTETQLDLNNEYYPRWQALSFFLLEWDWNLYSLLFGHGFPASGSEYLRILARVRHERFISSSDIGLISSCFFYGLLFLFIIYHFVFKALFTKEMPYYVKFFALWILFVPTIHGFGMWGTPCYSIEMVVFIYLTMYNSNNNNQTNGGCIRNYRKL
jgi:hypothetical protein